MGRVDHPHRAVHRHVSLAALTEAVLQQDFYPLPHAVRERDARAELCRRPPTAAAASAACMSAAIPVGMPNDEGWSVVYQYMRKNKITLKDLPLLGDS